MMAIYSAQININYSRNEIINIGIYDYLFKH